MPLLKEDKPVFTTTEGGNAAKDIQKNKKVSKKTALKNAMVLKGEEKVFSLEDYLEKGIASTQKNRERRRGETRESKEGWRKGRRRKIGGGGGVVKRRGGGGGGGRQGKGGRTGKGVMGLGGWGRGEKREKVEGRGGGGGPHIYLRQHSFLETI